MALGHSLVWTPAHLLWSIDSMLEVQDVDSLSQLKHNTVYCYGVGPHQYTASYEVYLVLSVYMEHQKANTICNCNENSSML